MNYPAAELRGIQLKKNSPPSIAGGYFGTFL